MDVTIASFPQLVAFLNQNGVPHVADLAEQVLESPIVAPPLEGKIYARWDKEEPFLQLVMPMIHDLAMDRLAEVETAIGRTNNGIALPGFGFDYTRRTIYYRVTLPAIDPLPAATVRAMVSAVVNTARAFLVPFRQVAEQGQPGATIAALVAAWGQADRAAAAVKPAPAETT
jgi:hypothetical protein